LNVFCGVDWAEDHHDVALVDADGQLITKRRINDDAAGFAELLGLFSDAGDTREQPIPVAIETGRGLLVACLRATGRPVYAINPMAVSRYRDRHSVARKKSDAGDAFVLANILRTDLASHRCLPADSELAQAIAVLARAQQDAVWERQQAANKLRSLLHEYYPSFLATFDDLASPDARATLAVAPTPAAAARLRRASLRAALIRGGRRRNLDHQVERILTGLRGEQFRQPALVEQAMGQQALAHLRALNTAVGNTIELEHALAEAFAQHPDAPILTSFPGLGTVLGARILGEIGDDRARFSDAKALKAFAGTAPVTRASGRKHSVTMRVVRNRRLCQAGYLWALPLLTHSPGARAHYDHRRERGDTYSAAARHLANRYFGILFHCLQHRLSYDETKAFPTSTTIAA
jgi:transposase